MRILQNTSYWQTISRSIITRSSHWRCSVRKGVLRNFGKFTEKHLCQSLFLIMLQALGITTNFLQSFSMSAWGHWVITGLHPSHFEYTVNDTILRFVYHALYLTNEKYLKKVNFPKIQDFHRGLRLVRRFQSISFVNKLVKRTSVITLNIV